MYENSSHSLRPQFSKPSYTVNLFRELYRRVGYVPPIYVVSPKEAELIEYASNVFLALKVVYANLIGLVCREIENYNA